MNVDQIRHLVLGGHLMAADEIDEHITRWQEGQGSPADGRGFVEQLVEQQALTEFQGKALRDGIAGPYKLGPYQVYDRVAAGRLGSIFRAVHEEFDQAVGLKIFPTTLDSDQEHAARLTREMRVAVQVDHPNVVQTYQVGRIGGMVFMVIEDLQGETLANQLRRQAQNVTPELPHLEACSLIRDAARGVEYLHSLEIVLRDIQPANIWVTANDRAKLMEFGAARDALGYLDSETGEEITTVMSTDLLGNFDYMSPEQGEDAHEADARSDIYSLGCVLFHCLTGEVAFPDASQVRKMLRHARETPRSVTEIVSEIPKAVADVVGTMLAKDADRRYQNAGDVAWALEQLIDVEEAQALATAEVDADFLEWANSNSEFVPSQDAGTAVADPGLLDFMDWMTKHEDEENE